MFNELHCGLCIPEQFSLKNHIIFKHILSFCVYNTTNKYFFATFSCCFTAPLGTPQLRRALISFCPVDNFIIIHYAQITYKYTNYLMTWIKRTLFPYCIHYKFKYFNLRIKSMCFILVYSK